LRFDGPHDRAEAVITIQAGAGGTDAQDWAEMLERMYLRWAEAMSRPTRLLARSVGEEAGIKHTTFEVSGKFAYGLLRGEHGVHRLVRQSPFNADSLRQTSFARVEVLPRLSAAEAPVIDDKDLKIDTFRASGAGGQHVNKTSSAVRIRHIPTGLVVECQNERSQGQNKAQALSLLQAKLQLLAEEQQAAKTKSLRGEIKEAAWGNQIRSYVLHPYRLVKDHRTNVETSDVETVLNGDLSVFLNMV
jgi:peptide chain release factor 2